MKRRIDQPRPLEDSLDGILRGLGASPDLVPLAILRAWPSVVGQHAAQKTQPVRLVRGRLYVHTTSEVWVTELLADADNLLARLAKAAGRTFATDLHVRVGDVVPAPLPSAPSAAPRTARAVPAEIEALLHTVTDPELRESIRRAVALSLDRTE